MTRFTCIVMPDWLISCWCSASELQGTDAEASLAALESTLIGLLSGLAAASTEPTGEGGASPAPQELSASLERLQMLLEEDDTDAVDLAAQIESQCAEPEFRREMPAIGQSTGNFEFDDALELLLAMRDRMSRRDG